MDYEERQQVRHRSVMFNIYVPVTLIDVVDRIADSENVPVNGLLVRLLRKGLQVERDERAAKANAD